MVCFPRLLFLYVVGVAREGACFLHNLQHASAAVSTGQQSARKTAGRRQRHVPLFDAVDRTPPSAIEKQALPQPLFLAVLREVQLESAGLVAGALYRGGFRMISVTANTPGFTMILRSIADCKLPDLTIGASSVFSEEQVDAAFASDARFISSTHCDVAVIRRTKGHGMISIPGVSTPAQALEAVQVGGDIIKAFPANVVSTDDFQKIVGSVSPTTPVIISGGLEVAQIGAYFDSGASGFAVGRTLFRPEMTLEELEAKARKFIRIHSGR